MEELQNLLAEEKEKVAQANEMLKQEQSNKEQQMKETRDAHLDEISSLQENITALVSIFRESYFRIQLDKQSKVP